MRKTTRVSLVTLLTLLAAVAGPGEVAARATAAAAPSSAAATSTFAFKVVDQNVEGKSSAVQGALTRAQAENANVILLQEVCANDYEALLAAHQGEWTFGWHASLNSSLCDEGRQTGQLAIYKGTSPATGEGMEFANQAFLENRNRMSRQGYACVEFVNSSIVNHVCSVHLVVNKTVGAMQAQEVKQYVNPFIQRDDLVVLAGDFNAVPTSSEGVLTPIYASNGGTGDFYEVSRGPGGGRCRCGDGTLNLSPAEVNAGLENRKIDYIFFSRTVTTAAAASSLQLSVNASDHKQLYGTAQVSY